MTKLDFSPLGLRRFRIAWLACLCAGCDAAPDVAVRPRERGGPVQDDSIAAEAQSVAVSGTLRFLALGDSYTIGEGVSPSDRWPVQLARRLRDECFDIAEPTIIAQTGWTTGELAARIDRASPEAPFHLVALLIGVNDQFRGHSAAEFRREFGQLVAHAVRFAAGEPGHVLVLSIPDWGVTPFAIGRNVQRIAGEIDQYNAIGREESLRVGARYVDVTAISRDARQDRSMLAADGLHPSGKMYNRWADLALPDARAALAPRR